jgi:hypothetical protein
MVGKTLSRHEIANFFYYAVQMKGFCVQKYKTLCISSSSHTDHDLRTSKDGLPNWRIKLTHVKYNSNGIFFNNLNWAKSSSKYKY